MNDEISNTNGGKHPVPCYLLHSSILVKPEIGFCISKVKNLTCAILLYIRKRQLNTLRSFESSDKTVVAGTGYSSNQEMKLRYGCISCSSEVKGSECTNCGPKMKKPLF